MNGLELQWRKCAGDAWCAFETVVLPDPNAAGVIVIWSAKAVLFVAAGGIAKALRWARQFEPIATHHDALVTWAAVPEDAQPGVRNYLAERLAPVHRERASPDAPIPVNLPFEP